MKINRREFLSFLASGCLLASYGLKPTFSFPESKLVPTEAKFWEKSGEGTTHCLLCPNGCIRGEGERSRCGVRETRGGELKTLVYSSPCVLALDPVEKCPLFHFTKGGNALSIATAGCNLSCGYCQNWQFSQKKPEEVECFSLPPSQVVDKAKEYKASSIAFFYTEPTIAYEYILDIATEAKKVNFPTIMVTAGYINPEPLKTLLPLIDSFTIGLKGFSEKYYSEVIGGTLRPVLSTIETVAAAKNHFEIVTLLLPTLNDNFDDIKKGMKWFAKLFGRNIPYHFSRFSPQYKLKRLPPTPIQTLETARRIAQEEGLNYVYTGNVPGHEGNHTYCPKCKNTIIERLGFQILKNNLNAGKCPSCGEVIPGVWS
ncbi:MAG: AmmeMemoRadiSam system radical SAM enzyme [Candidatus Riflebacteria bacterium]|nr:AmmeMemoRadiSam system radical SAM enzyme [Candidatus Riflebacteria bacterium]